MIPLGERQGAGILAALKSPGATRGGATTPHPRVGPDGRRYARCRRRDTEPERARRRLPGRVVRQDVQRRGSGSRVDDAVRQHRDRQQRILIEHQQDIASKQNADDHAAYLNSTTNYTYDPAGRLAQAVKTGNGPDTETYVHDDNGNVISQTIGGATTTYTYNRNRLISSAAGGQNAGYNYDPYGRLDTVTSAGQILSHNTYDGFDHIVQATTTNSAGTSQTTSYTFDPLDRTTSQTTSGKTTDYD